MPLCGSREREELVVDEQQRWRAAAASIVIVAAGVGIWAGQQGRPTPQGEPIMSGPEAVASSMAGDGHHDSDGIVTVHVAGRVRSPGLVSLTAGARVADAVQAAGGALADAVLGAVNLAAPVEDGSQILIPGPDEVGADPGGSGPTDADGLIRINHAAAADLETLAGVGPVLAERIVEHREAHGPFETVDELLDVSGIGEAKLASIRDQVVLR